MSVECECMHNKRVPMSVPFLLTALSAACSWRGILNGTSSRCICARSHYDPASACLPVVSYTSSLVVSATSSFVSCTPFASKITGFFDSPKPPGASFVYGSSAAASITSCSQGFGPPPRGVTSNPCNTFVGRDPSSNNSNAVSTCAAHGIWDAVAYRCSPCDVGWALRDSGVAVASGGTAVLCDVCAPFFGPKPPPPSSSKSRLSNYCSAIFTPNAEGIDAACGGRGIFAAGKCICFAAAKNVLVSSVFSTFEYTSASSGSLVALVAKNVSVLSC